jgi:glycosyltransferase involved in cell wall biosynthesis
MNLAARSSEPIRVLHVVGAMNRGGVETWIMHLVRRFQETRVRTDILVHTEEPAAYDAELVERGCRILRCPQVRRPVHYGRALRWLLREHGPYGVVHSHVHHFSGYVLRLARKECVPVRIAHSHNDTRVHDGEARGLRRGYLGLMRRWIARHATGGLAASREAGVALFGDPARLPWQVLYCSVDFAPFAEPVDRPAILAECGVPADSILMCHVGRFAEQKNHAFLLRIAADVFAREPRTHLVLIGEGPLRPAIEANARAIGIASRVHFLGPRPDVPRLLGAADVFLLPSLFEGLPLVALETQGAGIPVILTDTITREVDIVPGLVERRSLTESAATWGTAILAAIGRDDRPNRARALELAQQSPFDIRTGADQLERFYADALAAI